MSTQQEPDAAGPGGQLDAATRVRRSDYARVGGLALALLLGWLVWRIVQPLWQPLAWAVLLGALLAPLNARLAARLGGRQKTASAITTLATLVLFLLPVALVAGAVASQSAQLLARLDARATALTPDGFDITRVPWLAGPLDWIAQHTRYTAADLQSWLVDSGQRLLQSLASSGGSVVLGALGKLVSLALMIFVLFFMLRDGPELARKVVRMLPIEERRRSRLWTHLVEVTRAVFMGIGLTALIQGVLVGIGFWIAGLPSPLVFAVIGALCALVPIVGTALVWVPGALFLASQGDYGHATFLAAWSVIVVGSVDNFLRPLLISGRAELPTLAVFVGVMGGLSAFGFIGLFVGPIVLGLLVALFRFENEEIEAAAAQHRPEQ
ncbi:MAG: AI-2E family transporter [Steroidobacteraceae bacterium]